MKKRTLSMCKMFSLVLAVFFVFTAWATDRKPTVSSEALACIETNKILVCLDGAPGPLMSCELIDDSTVLCTFTN